MKKWNVNHFKKIALLFIVISFFSEPDKIFAESLGHYGDASLKLVECMEQKDLATCDIAIKEFTKAIQQNPKDEWAYLNRGDAYRFKGDKTKAIGDYNKAISINPKFGNAYYFRGNLYFQNKEYSKAIQDYTKAISNGYAGVKVYYARGDAFANEKNWGSAVADYTQCINSEPDNKLFYALRGYANENMGKNREAFNDYTKAISFGIGDAAVYFRRGMLRVELREGYVEEMAEDFNKAISLNPALAPICYLSLGILYDGVGKVDLAKEYFEKTVAADPNGNMGLQAKERLKNMR